MIDANSNISAARVISFGCNSLTRFARDLIVDYSNISMGNSQTLSCASGEKSTKAQQKEEQYKKVPEDKVKENGTSAEEAPAEDHKPENETAEEPAGTEESAAAGEDEAKSATDKDETAEDKQPEVQQEEAKTGMIF